ncbi:hypothetical protein EG68_05718 [Paragonimus skrjabini miyazakii]|uniref:F-box domain-containing protein n=1 Tax=Paragonimus skrjabini miyazakii TaxID=59628 RepID=A0A8S9YVH6_9TREM|nr:hypothetical protein EG68_05718 [Paragonimus skrjabini miyazakii]
MATITQLPPELVLRIFSHLNVSDLLHCAQVSHLWKLLTTESTLWFKAFQQQAFREKWFDRSIMRWLNVSGFGAFVHNSEPQSREYDVSHSVYCLKRALNHYILGQNMRIHSNTSHRSRHHHSIILGPGLDQTELTEALFRTILPWIDLNECRQFQRESQLFVNVSNAGWSGSGLAFRVPNQKKVLRLNTFHARVQKERQFLPYAGNRLVGSSLIDQQSEGHVWQLVQELKTAVNNSDSIIYVVNTERTKSDERVTDDNRWDEIRTELSAVTNCMRNGQTLLILGLCSETKSDHCLHPIEVAERLGEPRNSKCPENQEFPLENESVYWRIWNIGIVHGLLADLPDILAWLLNC